MDDSACQKGPGETLESHFHRIFTYLYVIQTTLRNLKQFLAIIGQVITYYISYFANEFPEVLQPQKLMETDGSQNTRNSCPKIQKLAYQVRHGNYGNYGNSETIYRELIRRPNLMLTDYAHLNMLPILLITMHMNLF